MQDLTAQQILKFLDSDLGSLQSFFYPIYSSENTVANKINRLRTLVQDKALNSKAITYVSRCPGRISLSKHADYINSDLLYTLDDRDIFVASQGVQDYADDNFLKLVIVNQDDGFENISFDIKEFLHNDDAKLDQYKGKWFFYIVKMLQYLYINSKAFSINKKKFETGLVLILNSDLPEASGLSSSHALILSVFHALIHALKAKDTVSAIDGEFWFRRNTTLKDFFESEQRTKNVHMLEQITKMCQAVEHAKGFNSGLGDPSVQLIGKKNNLAFIKLKPKLRFSFQDFDHNFSFITAPSFIKADKSSPEKEAANQNIKTYDELNQEVKSFAGQDFLADCIYELGESKIFSFLDSISDLKKKGLALYGLAEAARIKKVKEEFDIEFLGKHLNLSHEAERLYGFDESSRDWVQANTTEDPKYEYNNSTPLWEHSGLYLASTLENDQLQKYALDCDGVLGSSITGAGLGGSNIILCKREKASSVKQYLISNFYSRKGLADEAEKKVYISNSSSYSMRFL